jgi:hypothetical protein
MPTSEPSLGSPLPHKRPMVCRYAPGGGGQEGRGVGGRSPRSWRARQRAESRGDPPDTLDAACVGVCQRACCWPSVASTRSSRYHDRSSHFGRFSLAFGAGAPRRCRHCLRSPGAPLLHRQVSPPGPRADSRLCSCGGSISASSHSPLLHWTGSVLRVPVFSKSLFSRHLRTFKLKRAPCGCPAGPAPAHNPLSPPPLSSPPHARRAQEWTDCVDACGVQGFGSDRPCACRRVRRHEHQSKQERVCLLGRLSA